MLASKLQAFQCGSSSLTGTAGSSLNRDSGASGCSDTADNAMLATTVLPETYYNCDYSDCDCSCDLSGWLCRLGCRLISPGSFGDTPIFRV